MLFEKQKMRIEIVVKKFPDLIPSNALQFGVFENIKKFFTSHRTLILSSPISVLQPQSKQSQCHPF